MKIKRFENVWIMGLILSGAILLFLYILKLIFRHLLLKPPKTNKFVKSGVI